MSEDYAPGYTISEIEIGMEATFIRTITEDLINKFAEISGDYNPVHVDEEFAKTTRFKQRIAHGMLTASFVSTVLGTKLPGPGCIYIHQDLRFRAPVKIGDEVITNVKVLAVNFHRRVVTMHCECLVKGRRVLDGKAIMMVPAD